MNFLRLWLAFTGLVAFGAQVGATAITQGPTAEVTETNAVIRWTTDVVTGSRVNYGTSVSAMKSRAEGELGAEHVVRLKGLRAGTAYHYSVGTSRIVLGTNSFTTLGGAASSTPKDGASPGGTSDTAKPGGGAPPAKTALKPPPTRDTWGSIGSLQDHFNRHGRDFGAKDPDDYAAQAWLFLQRAKAEGLPAKRDSEGVLRVYDPKTGGFAAYNRNGKTKTYFKPGRRDYFDDQPGTKVDLRQGK